MCFAKKLIFRRTCIPMGLACFLLATACLPQKALTVSSTATLLEGVAKASGKQSDLRVIREGMPAYLMLMDGMVEMLPVNDRLLLAAAQAYSSFASAFAEEEDPEYAKILYARSKGYALRSLEARGMKDPVDRSLDSFDNGLHSLRERDAPYLFWAAASWGSWIRMNLDSMDALAQLPRVERMMRRVIELDEAYYYGGAHLFMGIWFASRPRMAGGDLKKAQQHFLRAIDLGEGKFLMAHVYYANFYARPSLDRNLFVSTLEMVLESPPDVSPELTLMNTVAQKRAKELLSHVEEYFE